MSEVKKSYIGDGVYVSLEENDSSIVLTTENGIEETNRIVLEFSVYNALERWVKGLDLL